MRSNPEIPPIEHLDALEILDSRGRPTVKVRCRLKGGYLGEASVPAGASIGEAEARELRDGDPHRYDGYGCRSAVDRTEGEIRKALAGYAPADQADLDGRLCSLDGTDRFERLGANAVLGVSLSFARAAAKALGRSLADYFGDSISAAEPRIPRPWINLLSGGLHAGGQVSIQDVMVVPVRAGSIGEALETAYRCREAAGRLLEERYGARRLTADEGGWAPPVESSEELIETGVHAVEAAGLRPGEDMSIGLDVAAAHFAEVEGRPDRAYRLDGDLLTPDELIDRLGRWTERYPIVSIEDGLGEEDWAHWPRLRKRLGDPVRVIGDDLLCTDPNRVERAAAAGAADTLLLKVNQAGTISRAARALAAARSAGWQVTASARSGDTEDDWLADLAVGWGADQIKVGSIAGSERLAKYNRLLELERRDDLPMAGF